MNILTNCSDLLGEHKLLYLIKSGSQLYGTNTPKSDTDYLGLFLPTIESCLLRRAPDHFVTSSSGKASNTQDDTDITLWSVQYWLNMVKRGDTQALDLLFSYTNKNAIIFNHEYNNHSDRMTDWFEDNHHALFNPRKANSFVGYAIGQASKYGIKGSRLGVLKQIVEYFDELDVNPASTLNEYMDDILEQFEDEKYCYASHVNLIRSIHIVGKTHIGNITMSEFLGRIYKQYEGYGARSHESIEGSDWKALSHAYRAVTEYYDLLKTGEIKFPLYNAELIKEIKSGKHLFESVQEFISKALEKIDTALTEPIVEGYYDDKFASNFILNLYK